MKALDELRKVRPKWFKAFQKNVSKWSEQQTPEIWKDLESQDPSGTLRERQFKRLVQTIALM